MTSQVGGTYCEGDPGETLIIIKIINIINKSYQQEKISLPQ